MKKVGLLSRLRAGDANGWFSFAVGVLLIYPAMLLISRAVLVKSAFPETPFDFFLNGVMRFSRMEFKLYYTCIGLFFGIMAFGCMFFLSKRDGHGARRGLRRFGFAVGALAAVIAFTGMITGSPLNAGRDFFAAGAPVVYVSPILAAAAVLVGRDRREKRYVCPKCANSVSAEWIISPKCKKCGTLLDGPQKM